MYFHACEAVRLAPILPSLPTIAPLLRMCSAFASHSSDLKTLNLDFFQSIPTAQRVKMYKRMLGSSHLTIHYSTIISLNNKLTSQLNSLHDLHSRTPTKHVPIQVRHLAPHHPTPLHPCPIPTSNSSSPSNPRRRLPTTPRRRRNQHGRMFHDHG